MPATTTKRMEQKVRLAREDRARTLETIKQEALHLLAQSHVDDPHYLEAEEDFYRVYEHVRKLVPAELAQELEIAANGMEMEARGAIARAWLRDRGSVPLHVPGVPDGG